MSFSSIAALGYADGFGLVDALALGYRAHDENEIRGIMSSYKKLDVYQCAIDYFACSQQIIKGIPKGSAVIVDQLHKLSEVNRLQEADILLDRIVAMLTMCNRSRHERDGRARQRSRNRQRIREPL